MGPPCSAMPEVLAMVGHVKCIHVLEIFRDVCGLVPKELRRGTAGVVIVVAMLTRPESVSMDLNRKLSRYSFFCTFS